MTAVSDRFTGADPRVLLTVEEAARRLNIGRTTMYALVSSGAVESVTIGRLRRVPSECLENFVAALRSSSRPEITAAEEAETDGRAEL
jgi:excisionase family DNA binding protein